jgi:hypothetical protein
VLGLVTRDLTGLYLFTFIFGVAWGNQTVLHFSLASEVFGLGSLGTIIVVLNFGSSGSCVLLSRSPPTSGVHGL